MKSTREQILRTLLACPESTINKLADAVGINGISVRHHLTALEAEDLVSSTEERHGVGRPRLIYSLTEKGIELFPTSYLLLTRRILGTLKNKLSAEDWHELFVEIGTNIAKSYEPDLKGKSLDERLEFLNSVLVEEGFIVEMTKNQDAYILSNLSCPYYHVGLDHPVVCTIDHTLISRLIGRDVEVQSCMSAGAERCVYTIPIQSDVTNA